jgi:hypothetical protein
LTAHSAWALKAILLIIAGAATVILAVAITKNVSVKPDSAPGGKVVGVRHDAAAMPPTGDIQSNVSGSSSDQENRPDTVVRNGVTVVSPQLLVPVIDIASLQAGSGSDDDSSLSKPQRKRSGYSKRTNSRRHARTPDRWKAYGLAIR